MSLQGGEGLSRLVLERVSLTPEVCAACNETCTKDIVGKVDWDKHPTGSLCWNLVGVMRGN